MGFSRQEYWSGLPFPSPGGSSRPRDRNRVSRVVGRCFYRLSHQGTPGTFILNKTKISAICKLSMRNNQTSETVRCRKILQEPKSWPGKPGTQLPLTPSPPPSVTEEPPWFRKKSTMHYYFYWSIIALQHRVGLCYRAE